MENEANERVVGEVDATTTEIKETQHGRSDKDTVAIRNLRRGINSLRDDKRTFFKPSWNYIEDVEALAITAVDLAEDLCQRLRLSGNNLYQKDNASWRRDYEDLYQKYVEDHHKALLRTDELKAATAAHATESKELRARIGELEEELARAKNNPYISQLEMEKKNFERQIQFLKEEADAREQYVTELEEYAAKLRSRINAGQEKLLQKAIQEKKAMAFQVSAYEQERVDLFRQLEEKEAEIEKLKADIEEITASQTEPEENEKPKVVYATELPEDTIRGIFEDFASGMSKNQISKKWHLGKVRVSQILEPA